MDETCRGMLSSFLQLLVKRRSVKATTDKSSAHEGLGKVVHCVVAELVVPDNKGVQSIAFTLFPDALTDVLKSSILHKRKTMQGQDLKSLRNYQQCCEFQRQNQFQVSPGGDCFEDPRGGVSGCSGADFRAECHRRASAYCRPGTVLSAFRSPLAPQLSAHTKTTPNKMAGHELKQ